MSDMSKAEKLAAARKKLKEFQNQQKNKEKQFTSSAQVPQLTRESNNLSFEQDILNSIPLENKDNFSNVNTLSSASQQQQLPSVANYFQNSNKNGFFFDDVHEHINGDVNTNAISTFPPPQTKTEIINKNIQSFPPLRTETPSVSSFFTSDPDNNLINIGSLPVNPTTEATDQNISSNERMNDVDKERLNALILELELANSKIKMQTDALNIVTAEKEDLQTKLTKALQEIDSYKDNLKSLRSELESNSDYQKQLEVTLEELKLYKEKKSTEECVLNQTINDLKEKNYELNLNADAERERSATLLNNLEETQSNYRLLSLKFQQLGINLNDDHNNDYQSIHEECELWKLKYDELENRLKTITFEKNHTEEEYRMYISNLKEELRNTSEELARLSEDNQVLTNKISSQTEHISTLEKQLQKIPQNVNEDASITKLHEEIQALQQQIQKDKEVNEELLSQLTDHEAAKRKIYELECEVENLKADMTNANELQMAIESSKVAASQAILQNNKLKNEFEQLHQMVQVLNEEKFMLSKMLEEEKIKNSKLTTDLQNEGRTNNHDIATNDAAINTDSGEEGENGVYGKANVEAMLQLQDKFKCVLDRMADLTDEKQQLEHLVLQLQCETETIEEYVALYQKQRSILQQRAQETDLKMERVSQEKERLLNILRSILNSDEFDCAFVKQLVEHNLSIELSEELRNSSTINYNYIQETRLPKNDDHHPSCPCCSGQLITI